MFGLLYGSLLCCMQPWVPEILYIQYIFKQANEKYKYIKNTYWYMVVLHFSPVSSVKFQELQLNLNAGFLWRRNKCRLRAQS